MVTHSETASTQSSENADAAQKAGEPQTMPRGLMNPPPPFKRFTTRMTENTAVMMAICDARSTTGADGTDRLPTT